MENMKMNNHSQIHRSTKTYNHHHHQQQTSTIDRVIVTEFVINKSNISNTVNHYSLNNSTVLNCDNDHRKNDDDDDERNENCDFIMPSKCHGDFDRKSVEHREHIYHRACNHDNNCEDYCHRIDRNSSLSSSSSIPSLITMKTYPKSINYNTVYEDPDNHTSSDMMTLIKSKKTFPIIENNNSIHGSTGKSSTTTSGCSTQSSSSSSKSISMPSAIHLFHRSAMISENVCINDHHNSSNYVIVKQLSSSSSPQSNKMSTDFHRSISSPSPSPSPVIEQHSSIKTIGSQWEKIGNFIQFYEQNLLQCLHIVQQRQWKHLNHQQQSSNTLLNRRSMDENNREKMDNLAADHVHSINDDANKIENFQSLSVYNDGIQPKSSDTKPSSCDESNDEQSKLYDSLCIQLEKIAKIREKYLHSRKCQEALIKMTRLSPNGSNRFRKNCYHEWRTNEQMLQSLAMNLRSMIGTFEIIIENIEGWARICPNDYYEIEFRYGHQQQQQQKFILRVKIMGRQLQRKWDFDRNSFKFQASLQTHIVCKISEIKPRLLRSLTVWPSKHVEIGTTLISLSDLLRSVCEKCPLLIDCNPSGSLKLRLNCRWNPNCDDNNFLNFFMFKKDLVNRRLLKSPSLPSPGRLIRQRSWLMNYEKPFNSISRRKCSEQLEPQPLRSSSFGINKNLARSLLSLPTFVSTTDLAYNSCTLPKNSRNNCKNFDNFDAHDNDNVNVENSDRFSLRLTSSSSSRSCPYDQLLESTMEKLNTLELSLQDHYGLSIEITLMSQAIKRLITLYERLMHKMVLISNIDNDARCSDDEKNIVDHRGCRRTSQFIEEAFEFLVDSSSDDFDNDSKNNYDTIVLCNPEEMNNDNDWCAKNAGINFNEMIIKFDRILAIHTESAIKHLSNVGTWILKSKEKCAFSQLQSDTFAMDQIYMILLTIYKFMNADENPDCFNLIKQKSFGEDERVLEIMKYCSDSDLKMIFTFDQFYRIILSMMRDTILTDESSFDYDDSDDLFIQSAKWLTATIISCGNVCFESYNNNHSEHLLNYEDCSITLFMIRAFFELHLFDNYISTSKRNNNVINDRKALNLTEFFHIALNMNRLLSKIRVRKWPLSNVERILFKQFNANCQWLPPDLTLLVINILFEHRSMHNSIMRKNHDCLSVNYESNRSRSSISDLKKFDRYRELCRLINQLLITQWQLSRFEIREHILIGLESSCTATRQASCYGIMHLIRLIQRINSSNEHRFNEIFYGKEMDYLLYISMEDSDICVRNEAKNVLKFLSCISGQQQLPYQQSIKKLSCKNSMNKAPGQRFSDSFKNYETIISNDSNDFDTLSDCDLTMFQTSYTTNNGDNFDENNGCL